MDSYATNGEIYEEPDKGINGIINKLYRAFEDFMFDSYCKDRSKLLTKVCKKNKVQPRDIDRFVQTQKAIFYERKRMAKPKDRKIPIENSLFPVLIYERLYGLTDEFLFLIHDEYKNSINSLTRQMVELYILTLHCRLTPSYKQEMVTTKNEFRDVGGKIKQLKKSPSFMLPYMSGDKIVFLDGVYSTFKAYSNVFHPSSLSFSRNVWVLPKNDTAARFYRDNPQLSEGDAILTFIERPFTPEELLISITNFFIFAELVLQEIRLAD